MESGTVTALRTDKGYGFIQSPGQADLFFHMRDLVGLEFDETLRERRVRFDIVDTDRGPRACNVQAVE